MKYILVILFLFSGAVKVSAFFERGLSAAAGSNPKGANINASLAYNQLMWDGRSQNDESPFWKYGYLRPKVYYETSYVINTVSAELQVYPISIFGGSVGYKNSDRAVKSLELYECDKIDCQGQVTKSFYNLNLNLGYRSWVMALIYENTQLKTSSDIPPLVEYSSMLLIPSRSETMENKVAILGYKWNENLTIGFYENYYQIKDKKSEGQYLVGNYKYDDLSWVVGAGTFGSDYFEKTFAAFIQLSWKLDPSLSL